KADTGVSRSATSVVHTTCGRPAAYVSAKEAAAGSICMGCLYGTTSALPLPAPCGERVGVRGASANADPTTRGWGRGPTRPPPPPGGGGGGAGAPPSLTTPASVGFLGRVRRRARVFDGSSGGVVRAAAG